jgi:hypothetical protein
MARSRAKQGNQKSDVRVRGKDGNVIRLEDGRPISIVDLYRSPRGHKRRKLAMDAWKAEAARIEAQRRVDDGLFGKGF